MGSTMDDVFNGGQARSERDKATAIGLDNAQDMRGLKLPTINWENYNPEDTKYQTVSEDPAIREQQLGVLKKMSGLADSGLSDEDQLGFFKAKAMGDQMARAGNEAAIQNAAARGVSGSGMEFASREAANQAGAQRAQEAAMEQAATAAKQRALYASAYGDALGRQRQQDFSANAANTDIINKFNSANTVAHNAAQQYNQQGERNVAQQNFSNDLTKRQNVAGAMNNVAQNHLANSASASQQGNALFGAAVGAATAAATGGASAAKPNAPLGTDSPTGGSAGGVDPEKYANIS